MKDFVKETVQILRKNASKQESLSPNSYGEFRDSFDKDFEYFESLLLEVKENSPTRTICHNFLDQWLDEVNHDFQGFYGVQKQQWPILANKLANELEVGGAVHDHSLHEKFILKPRRSLKQWLVSLFKG